MIIVGVSLLVLALSAIAILLALRWRRATRVAVSVPDTLRHPLVMVHGLFGFDEISALGWKRDYFRGMESALADKGAVLYRPRVPPTDTVPTRALRLARYIEKLPEGRVNIIAHSMGGLDARYAIAKLGIADRVASLVTIGTPHHGSPLAELKDRPIAVLARKLAAAAGVRDGGFDWLTPATLVRFNDEVKDDHRVHYACVISSVRQWSSLHPLLVPSHHYLRKRAGDNDGVVPVASQIWGETLAEIEGDHWAQIGWSRHFDVAALYRQIADALIARGL